MSCFVLGNEHISVVVAGLFQYGVVAPDADARQLGADLLVENKVSFHCNYQGRYDHEVTGGFELFTTESPLHPIALLKALNCYTYQSCDGVAWTSSRAFEHCELLALAVLSQFPSLGEPVPDTHNPGRVQPAYLAHPTYEAAPYVVESFDQVHVDRFAPVTS